MPASPNPGTESGAKPSPFAQFGMISRNRYAGLCPSAPDEPGDPQPGDEPDLPATYDPFAPDSSHGDLDPATGASGIPRETTTLPSHPAQGDNKGSGNHGSNTPAKGT
ncbi:uncharacterized protein PV07_00417 [Cladophialophora immunda]|uniref:Uncharacterized protein n=1 Tax=Cladophialophora immunda TaxID=569365 RepID=A0A0D2DD02_9EURO|nr:uncharacterized protein PV07_00417 [Cladophialophora immunda]KIW33579.1 hypothetical protein PV07_00417 [Cladophialophora immunda]